MAKRLITSRVDRLFKDATQSLINSFSSRTKVVAVTETPAECPNCLYDVVSRSSTGKYKAGGPTPFTGTSCPVCGNTGQVKNEVRRTLKVRARFAGSGSNPRVPVPGGEEPQGTVQIKGESSLFQVLQSATYFLIDGVRYVRDEEPTRRGLLTYASADVTLRRND